MTDLLNGPAGVPPAGTISQLDNPPNQKTTTHVVPILSIVLVSLLVAMRMYTTVFITRRVGVADCEPSTFQMFSTYQTTDLICVIDSLLLALVCWSCLSG